MLKKVEIGQPTGGTELKPERKGEEDEGIRKKKQD